MTKHQNITRQNYLFIENFMILKGLKGLKKIQELPPFGKFVIEVLDFEALNTYFQLKLLFIAGSLTGFCS